MNRFQKNLRMLSVILGLVLGGMLLGRTLVDLFLLLNGNTADAGQMIAMLLWAAAGVFLIVSAWRRYKGVSSGDKMQRRQERMQRFLLEHSACPVCKSKLAVCHMPQSNQDFPQLFTGSEKQVEAVAYYCPQCHRYFQDNLQYDEFKEPSYPCPNGDGNEYHFSEKSLRGQWISLAIWLAMMAALIVYSYINFRSIPNAGWMDILPMLLVFGLGTSLSVSIFIRVVHTAHDFRAAYYELAPDGLIFNDAHQKWFYPWSTIRIVTQITEENAMGIAAAFDTTMQNFILSSNVNNGYELLKRILLQLPPETLVDEKLRTLLALAKEDF